MAHQQLLIGEGVTDPIVINLVNIDRDTDEVTSYLSLVGATEVVARFRSWDKEDIVAYSTVDDPTNLAITDEDTGEITLYPTGAEFTFEKHNYDCYFLVTDAGGYVIRVPQDGVITIEIVEAF